MSALDDSKPCPLCRQPTPPEMKVCFDCALGDVPEWVPRCLGCRRPVLSPEIAAIVDQAAEPLVPDDCSPGFWHPACAPGELR